MTDFQLGLLLLLTAFVAGFICGMIVGVNGRAFRCLAARSPIPRWLGALTHLARSLAGRSF